ncbi:MAG: 2-amino-4-hydroxy-6-hydroxymethyldihydropteridine diphosphokinase [Muribaculaceae bacterium]|nr:2-amino-4-hydroxy-6-hydroxymethyldihydropteridine diphosphokinase [Muribaculaceae bacterium]
MKYYINIGTNLGNRRLNLSKAVAAVEREFGYFEISKVVESEPWGYDSTNMFLNVAMMFESDEEPVDVLHKLQAIEKSLSPESHRNADGSYKDRLIDIDIMAIENVEVDLPELKVPHPHLFDRPFFINPLKELLGKA